MSGLSEPSDTPSPISSREDIESSPYQLGSILMSSLKHMTFDAEVLEDIGVYPLDDEESCDNDENFSASAANYDLKAFYNVNSLGPTPPTTVVGCISSSRVLQPHNASTPVGPAKCIYARKRPRLDVTTDQDDIFHAFSDEIILMILKWLPKSTLKRCATVCKRWRRLAYDESLWKCIDLGNMKLGPGTLSHIIQRGVIAMRLSKADISTSIFAPFPGYNRSVCSVSNQRFCKLQYLNLSMATISTSGLEELFSSCKWLQKLCLEHCKVNDRICKYLGENKNLQELNLALCSGITANGLKVLLHGCQKLMALNLAWTNLSIEALQIAVQNFPKCLTKLNLSGCRETLTDTYVECLVERCDKLKELDISDAMNLTEVSVEHIVNLTELEVLALSRCCNINPNVLWLLCGMLSLAQLDIFGIFNPPGLDFCKTKLGHLRWNTSVFSTIARPTTGIRRTSIWGIRVRE